MSAGHLLINGLSIGSGGGFTVGRGLAQHLAMARPTWTVTLALIAGHPLHETIRSDSLPPNCEIYWAPSTAARRLARDRYERGELVAWAKSAGVDRVLQLNGMVVPGMPWPTLAHNQDPMPYRPEAWNGWRDRVVHFFKRRAHARAFSQAASVGFTSAYLRDLMMGALGIQPRRPAVYYNGLPEEMLARAEAAEGLPSWADRPMEIVTVSNVDRYKRQDLVLRALPLLIKRPGLQYLRYRVVGHCPPEYAAELQQLAASLGVADRFTLTGRVPDEQVKAAFLNARCYVLMSVCESFGIPAVEAMSFGTPVVTADCCAMPEVCGPAADLVPVDDLEQLTVKIERVLTDPAHAEDLRRDGAARVAKFHWAETAKAMALELDAIALTPAFCRRETTQSSWQSPVAP